MLTVRMEGARPAEKQTSFAETGPKPMQAASSALSRRNAGSLRTMAMIAALSSVKRSFFSCPGGSS